MNSPPDTINHQSMQRRFARAASSFDVASFVHQQTLRALLDRLAPVVMSPALILDIGAGTGIGSRALAKHYRKSRVVSLDLSADMLALAKGNKPFFSKLSELRADANQLPISSDSVDLVFANLLLPWIDDLSICLAEISRILKKGGVFAFATLGPDSLNELRRAWATVDSDVHVRSFADMHDVGDALLQNGLADPVLDVDYLTVTYEDTISLYRDLSACGARNSLAPRRKSLTGKNRFTRMENAITKEITSNRFKMTLELVYGHAWGVGPRPKNGEFHLDANTIPRRERR
ncbi:MAG: methyltransferase domain-containing protein [Woeseia sp.]|jgi:malonyl-CoA O-methyltransferase|nr:methyltransferase domain-containing protein [Woeseia sp.]MBT6209802.1 methyltransferase domain-containing protein [Woeseia sp.]